MHPESQLTTNGLTPLSVPAQGSKLQVKLGDLLAPLRGIENRISGVFNRALSVFRSRPVPEGEVLLGDPYVVDDSPSGWQLARSPATFGGNLPEWIPTDAYGLAKDSRGRLVAISPRNGRAILIPQEAVGDFTRLRPAEIDTMIRARRQLGLDLFDSPHEGAEYIDSAGRSFDQMGSPENAAHWNAKQFFASIDWHLTKSNNFTIIDLTGYSSEQRASVGSYVSKLPPEQRAKILRLGF